jgi:hypothetical protein
MCRFTINGYSFANLPGLSVSLNDTVRWYLFSLGGFHAPQWQGNSVIYNGRRVNTVPLLPGVTAVADMSPTTEGVWAFFCRVKIVIRGGAYIVGK